MSGYHGDSTDDFWRHVRQREQGHSTWIQTESIRKSGDHRGWLRRLGERIRRAVKGA